MEEIQLKNKDLIKEAENPIDDKTQLTMDDALKKLGGFSYCQIFVMIPLLFFDFPSGLITLSPILIVTSQVPFTCFYENGTQVLIPKNDLCKFNCTNGEIRSITKPIRSIVQEWDLFCDQSWIADTIISIQSAGSLTGALLMAYFADRYGRKATFYAITFLMGLSGIFCSISLNPIVFGLTRFLSGLVVHAGFTIHFTYLMEFLPIAYRQICGCVTFWPIGEMSLALVGYLIPNWRTLTWVASLPAFLVFLSIFYVPESPRWALANGKTEIAEASLLKIAKYNGKPPLTQDEIKAVQNTVLKEKKHEESQKKHVHKVWNLRLLRTLVIFWIVWISNSTVYFGITFNTKNISGDPYWNIFWLGLVDFPAELSGFYFSNRFGRKKTFIITLLTSSAFLVALAVVNSLIGDKIPYLVLGLSLAGKFFNEASWCIMACFTSESFPTICRSLAFSICVCGSTLGAIVAPQLTGAKIPPTVPYGVFAGVSVFACLISISLPEMRGKPLIDR